MRAKGFRWFQAVGFMILWILLQHASMMASYIGLGYMTHARQCLVCIIGSVIYGYLVQSMGWGYGPWGLETSKPKGPNGVVLQTLLALVQFVHSNIGSSDKTNLQNMCIYIIVHVFIYIYIVGSLMFKIDSSRCWGIQSSRTFQKRHEMEPALAHTSAVSTGWHQDSPRVTHVGHVHWPNALAAGWLG